MNINFGSNYLLLKEKQKKNRLHLTRVKSVKVKYFRIIILIYQFSNVQQDIIDRKQIVIVQQILYCYSFCIVQARGGLNSSWSPFSSIVPSFTFHRKTFHFSGSTYFRLSVAFVPICIRQNKLLLSYTQESRRCRRHSTFPSIVALCSPPCVRFT